MPGSGTVTSRRLRGLRTAAFGAAGLLLGVLGHKLTSPGPPGMAGDPDLLPVLIISAPAVLALGWWLSRRERGFAILLSATFATQATLHAAMSVVMATSTTDATASAAPAASVGQHMAGGPLHGLLPMLLAHAISGIIAAWAMRHGERTIFLFGALTAATRSAARLLRQLARRTAPCLTVAACSLGGLPAPTDGLPPWRPTGRFAVAARVTRGPPAAASAA